MTDAALPVSALPTPVPFPVLQLDALPVEPLVLLAFLLLVGGVLGSVVPVLPSGALSLAGVYVYWWGTDFSEPGLLVLSGLTLLGILTMAVEWLSGLISAKAGGASTKTTILATLVGFVGLVAAGPVGFLVGTAGTVFLLELRRQGDVEESARAAGVTLLGMLTSNVLQVLLTVGMLLVMLWVAFL